MVSCLINENVLRPEERVISYAHRVPARLAGTRPELPSEVCLCVHHKTIDRSCRVKSCCLLRARVSMGWDTRRNGRYEASER
jgi:hypothetical protein